MSRNIVRVLPQDGNWKVTFNSIFKKKFELKSEAISYWRELAQNNKPSQLVIHKADWTIEIEYTYWNDPYPPKW